MSLTTTETFGFTDTLVEALTNHQAELLAVGLDVTGWITDLQAKKEDALTKNDEQETAKVTLVTRTQLALAALELLYKTSSTRVDAVAGVVGKTTPLGMEFLTIRSEIRRGPGPTPVAPPSP